jgi:hypothetical protein
MIEEIGAKQIFYGMTSYVYQIQVKQSSVFMRIDRTNFENDNRYVAIVNTNKFYKLWTGNTIDHCIITDEKEQKQYSTAIDGFSRGIENPVPLAEFGYHNFNLSFTNGITRTKWLILNGAVCFPLECNKTSAMGILKEIPDILYSTKVVDVLTLLEPKN